MIVLETGRAIGHLLLEGALSFVDFGHRRIPPTHQIGFERAPLLFDFGHRGNLLAFEDIGPFGQIVHERPLALGQVGERLGQARRSHRFHLLAALLERSQGRIPFGAQSTRPLLDALVPLGDLGHRRRVFVAQRHPLAFEFGPGPLRFGAQINADAGDLPLGLGQEGCGLDLAALTRRLDLALGGQGGGRRRVRSDLVGFDFGNAPHPLGHGLGIRTHPNRGFVSAAPDEHGFVFGLGLKKAPLMLSLHARPHEIGSRLALDPPDLFLPATHIVEQASPLGLGRRHRPLKQFGAQQRRLTVTARRRRQFALGAGRSTTRGVAALTFEQLEL